jgi:menaquinol-cytochrome c reductase iron-sulfur subunit
MSFDAPGERQPAGRSSEASRRSFMVYVATAVSSFIGVVVAVPIVTYLTAPLRTKQESAWVSLGKVSDFTGTDPKPVQFTQTRQDGWVEIHEARTCWVLPKGPDSFTVYNGRCTHLGCAYSWNSQGQYAGTFHCPCHDGVYSADGTVMSGPPPRSLDTMETKVENGELFVLFQDYRLGTPTKAEV